MNKLEKELRENFSYNSKTGEIKRLTRENSNGSYDKDGYLIIKFKGKQIKAHRLAWFLYYDKFPSKNIDHMNRNRTDNRIKNLRDVEQKINVYNTRREINKDTGVIGVYLDKCTKGLKKRFTFRFNKKIYRFYTIEEAVKKKYLLTNKKI